MIHQQGIVYAKTSDGMELPIVDITTQLCRTDQSNLPHRSHTEQYKPAEEKQAKMPIFLRRFSMKLGSRRSQILRALIES